MLGGLRSSAKVPKRIDELRGYLLRKGRKALLIIKGAKDARKKRPTSPHLQYNTHP